VAEGVAVSSVVVSGKVVLSSEVVSRSVRSVRTGASPGSSAVANAIAAIAEITTVPSAHVGASTATNITCSRPRARSSRRSDRSTPNAHRSMANATNNPTVVTSIRPTSYAISALCAFQRRLDASGNRSRGRLFPVLGRGYAGDEGELSKIHTLGNPVTRQPRAARRRPHRRRLHRRSTEKMATPDLVDGDGSHPLLPAKAGPPAGEVVCGQGVLLTHNTLKLIHIVLNDGVCPPMLYCDQLILSLVLPHYSSVSFPQVPCLKRLCISRAANPRW
jgi:hypothetical protein